MIALIYEIINLVIEVIDISQSFGCIKDFIRIIEVVSIILKIISYISCNKLTANTVFLISIFIIPNFKRSD